MCLVIRAKLKPVLLAILAIATAIKQRKIFPTLIAVNISLKLKPLARPPPVIILVITKTNPSQTIVIDQKLFLASFGTAEFSKSISTCSVLLTLILSFMLPP